jgi:hypothetical protein
MSDFKKEFGFIPPELLYKCDTFVRAFHGAQGSSFGFVAASCMFSEESPYLTFLERKGVSILKIIKGFIAVSVVVFIAAVLTKMWWLLAGIVPIGAAVLYFSKLMGSTLIEQRAIISAVEALATDFVGWGQLFPIARSRAEAMFARDAGDWPKLIELYLPRERRTDAEFIRMFTPSESSIA